MIQRELRNEITRKLDDVNMKIDQLKNMSNMEPETNRKLQEALIQLESIRKKIMSQYQAIDDWERADKEKISGLGKSFDSFEIAYSNSRPLIKRRKFSTRERSVDFKNPFGNR